MLCDVSLGVLVWLFVHRFSVNNVNNEIVYCCVSYYHLVQKKNLTLFFSRPPLLLQSSFTLGRPIAFACCLIRQCFHRAPIAESRDHPGLFLSIFFNTYAQSHSVVNKALVTCMLRRATISVFQKL